MSDDITPRRSRRALLVAAAGGAAALAAQAALPLTVSAADPNDVVIGITNVSTATTAISNTTDGSDGFEVATTGSGRAVVGQSPGAAGVFGVGVDGAGSATDTVFTGVYGWAPADTTNGLGTGVWGDSEDYGVYGSGAIGVYGYGAFGVIGESGDPAYPAVSAYGATTSSPALQVVGKVKFSRSGRTTLGAGKSSLTVTLAGTTSGSKVFAVLGSNRAGRYVRAVVPTTGKFTVYLNTTVTAATYVTWWVLD
jgi:hypothetical protein